MSIDVEASLHLRKINRLLPLAPSPWQATFGWGPSGTLEPSQPRILRKYPKLRLATTIRRMQRAEGKAEGFVNVLEHFREIGWMSWWLSNLHWSFLPTAASISCYFLISSYNLVASWSWLHWRLLPLMAMLIALGSTLALVPGIRAPACLGRLQRQRLQRQVIPKCIPQLRIPNRPPKKSLGNFGGLGIGRMGTLDIFTYFTSNYKYNI